MASSSKMVEPVLDYSRFFLDDNKNPLDNAVRQWKMVEYHKTPAGCPIPKNGEIWNPVIGGGPFRPYMVPKGVAVADGVLLMVRLFYNLPFEIGGVSGADLLKLMTMSGFTLTDGMLLQRSMTPRVKGSTVYNVDGNLITINQAVMRGDSPEDAITPRGLISVKNVLYRSGESQQLWFNRLFNGADTASPEKGAAFAQNWLTKFSSNIKEYDKDLKMDVRRRDSLKAAQYQNYLSKWCSREIITENMNPPKPEPTLNPNSASKGKLIIKLKLPQKDGRQGDREIPLEPEPRTLLPCPGVSTVVKKPGNAALAEPDEDKDNEASNGEIGPAPTMASAELAREKSAETLENLAPTSQNSIAAAPVETAAERAARLRRKVAELQIMEAEATEQAIAEAIAEAKAEVEKAAMERAEAEKVAKEKTDAEKAAVEKEASKQAEAEKATMEREAAEKAVADKAAATLAKADAESNRRAAEKSFRCTGETIKCALGAYIAQRKTGAVDKKLVGKWDKELVPIFQEAFNITSRKPQKRNLSGEENYSFGPAKRKKK